MNTRFLIAGALAIVALAAGAVVLRQHRQLSQLQTENRNAEVRSMQTASERAAASVRPNVSAARPSAELLELRAKVTQLMARKAELAGVADDNVKLQSQLAGQGTNSFALPPGYIRTRDAKWVGTSTPESTVESFLWAVRNRDTNVLFQVLSDKSREQLALMLQRTPAEKFFDDNPAIPGIRITDIVRLPDGRVEAKLEVLPGKPEPGRIHFHYDHGAWKMDLP